MNYNTLNGTTDAVSEAIDALEKLSDLLNDATLVTDRSSLETINAKVRELIMTLTDARDETYKNKGQLMSEIDDMFN